MRRTDWAIGRLDDIEDLRSNDIVLDSRKLLRLFIDEPQTHQLTKLMEKAYSGKPIVSGVAHLTVKDLLVKGLIEVISSDIYRNGTELKYYGLTGDGWDIAHPTEYPPEPYKPLNFLPLPKGV